MLFYLYDYRPTLRIKIAKEKNSGLSFLKK